MRHRKRGRYLNRSSSHRKAMWKNMVSSLFLTEREEFYYEGLTQADGKTPVKPPRPGRIVTTLPKAKEARSYVERVITLAKNALAHEEKANTFACTAAKDSAEWKSWRESDKYKQWVAAIAPVVNARRQALVMLGDKEAVSILFSTIAPRYVGRPGGYTRVLKLADPRLGDAGAKAILELVGREAEVAAAPVVEG